MWIDLKHITDIVLGLRVIDGVQGNGLWVMVDGNINVPSQGLLQSGGCSTTASEKIDRDLRGDGQQKLLGGHGLILEKKNPVE